MSTTRVAPSWRTYAMAPSRSGTVPRAMASVNLFVRMG